MTLTTERMAEIAKLAIRLQQISSCAAVTGSGETVLHHTHVNEILSALHDVTSELLANREAQPVGVMNIGSETCSDYLVAWTKAGAQLGNGVHWLYTAPPAPASEPIFFIEVEGDDWINAGRIPGSTFDFNNLPDGVNKLYAAPPAPANANAVAWEMRYWNSGHNMWHDWERITAEQHAEMSVQHAADNDYEFRVLYDVSPAPAVPDDYQHLKNVRELYHKQEDRLFSLAQRIKGASFDKYSHVPSQAIDVLEREIFGDDGDACRAAMLAQPVSGGYKLVPAEPTEDMIAAAMNCDDVSFNADETFCVNFGNIYAAMLAAAPEGGNG